MSTYYDTLGVPESASEQTIKAAYRRKASAEHPDRGGNTAAMTDINRAYACLSDPVKRLAYDRSGQDQPDTSLNEEMRAALLEAFNFLLVKNIERDCMQHVEKFLYSKRVAVEQQRREALSAQRHLNNLRKNIKSRLSENFFHMLIDQQLKHIEAALLIMDRKTDVINMALESLKNYESVEQMQMQPGYFYLSMAAA